MAQFARPSSDISAGSWSSTPLWSKINASVGSGDATVITSDNNTSPDTFRCALSAVTNPAAGDVTLRIRWRKSDVNGHVINAVARLYEGANVVRALTVNGIGNTFVTSTAVLTQQEADGIGNWSNLFIEVDRDGDTAGQQAGRRSLIVADAELETPDAADTQEFDHSLSGTVSFAGGLVRGIDKSLSGVVPLAGDLLRDIAKQMTAALSLSGALTTEYQASDGDPQDPPPGSDEPALVVVVHYAEV